MFSEYSAGIVIFRKQDGLIKYLLLKGEKNRVDFPKGNLEKNESLVEAAKREANEETGITNLKIYPDFKKRIDYFYIRTNGQKVYKTVVYFLGQTNSEEIQVSGEHIGFEWLTFEEAIKKIKYKSMKELFQEAEKYRVKNNYSLDNYI